MGKQQGHSKGKLGLALSGGGLRASYFHIGVLARMAELNLLREVEVISTVSGGSIIGALYYLRLRNLLQEKKDQEIEQSDYLDLVACLAEEFFEATKVDLRTRTFANPFKNLKMSRPDYSRSDRIGELYEEFIYGPAFEPKKRPEGRIAMQDLKIRPRIGGTDEKPEHDLSFHPGAEIEGGRTANSVRLNKVPVLLINATTLNSGHNWRFQASTMGEAKPKNQVDFAVDKNIVLCAPPSYDDIVSNHQDMELGNAVAASAAVPGIFHPFALSGLYPGFRVQLVDGGVHDNQGIQALKEKSCERFVISDASGPLLDDDEPSTNPLGVIGRTTGVLMDRVREEEIGALYGQRNSNGKQVAFLHLLKDIAVESLRPLPNESEKAVQPPLGYPVDPAVQVHLARIRTDLDAFSETEAFSLMADGYLMSGPEIAAELKVEDPDAKPGADIPERWIFAKAAAYLADPDEGFEKQLEVGGERLFKLFRLKPLLWILPAIVLAAGLVALYIKYRDHMMAASLLPDSVIELSWHDGILVLLLAIVTAFVSFIPRLAKTFKILKLLYRIYQWPPSIYTRYFLRAIPAFIVAGIAWFHINVVVRLFLRQGRLEPRG